MSSFVHDDHIDVVCSALAVNCCQFGCFIQNSPRIPCASENHDWMTKLRENLPSKRLRNLVIPGTHDSASVTISKWSLFAAVGLCQNITVGEQLRRGARYIDIRIGSGVADSILMEDVKVVHGILTGGKFVDILEEVDLFLCDNPGEFVVMEVVLENKRQLTPEQRIKVLKLINSTFGDRMVTKDDDDSWFNLKYVTLGELAEKNKNILVLLHERICGFCHEEITFGMSGTHCVLLSVVSWFVFTFISINNILSTTKHQFVTLCVTKDADRVTREFNCHKNENYMRNKWHNTMDPQQILSSNEEFLETYCKHRGKLLNSQFVMTPAFGGVENVPGLLFGMKSLRPVSLARKLYRKEVLETFLRDKADFQWNIVLLDFVDLCPLLVRFLIGLNSPKKLTIEKATVKSASGEDSSDVTETIQNLVKRECILYLVDFYNDLKLDFDEGEFSVKAKFDDERFDRVIVFNKDTEFLLCDETFMCNDCH